MPVRSLAIVSLHTSPLAQPGSGDGGGMNVYVRSLAAALARAGVSCDVYTRTEHPDQSPIVMAEPNVRVFHVDAGPRAPVAKESLLGLVDEFTDAMYSRMETCGSDYDALHANYWLSAKAAHTLKHRLSLPMIVTFHTLARVKSGQGATAAAEVQGRESSEVEVARCADLILASTSVEQAQLQSLYDAVGERIEILAPGVDHRIFSPGSKTAARARLGHPGERVALFVGRIQPLKGLDLALRSVAEIDDGVLWVVGGPSGADGPAEMRRIHALIDELGLEQRVVFVPPRPHHQLADYYRAADVCVVPSHSESFGLVALEAAGCGTPVVAAAVGGLRSIVDDGATGFLVEGRDPLDWATPIALLLDDPELAAMMGTAAVAHSGRWSWNMTAARLRRLCGDLAERTPVECS